MTVYNIFKQIYDLINGTGAKVNSTTPISVRNDKEIAARTKTQILRFSQGTTGTNNLYTVPADKVLYVTNITLAGYSTAASFGSVQVNLVIGGTQREVLFLVLQTADDIVSDHATFPMPIKLTATDNVEVEIVGNDKAGWASMQGWLEDA